MTTEGASMFRRSHWMNQVARHSIMLGEQPAIRFEGATITWRELSDRVDELAEGMRALGVSGGGRVAMIMGNRPEFIETMLAINRLGAIAVPINHRLAAPEVAFILKDSGPSLVFIDELGSPVIRSMRVSGLPLPSVVALSPRDDDLGYVGVPTQVAQPFPDVAEDLPALIMYTSGTTGRPKGAVLTHANLHAQAITAARACGYVDEEEVSLIASPLFHIGAIGSVAPTIFVGGTLVIHPTRSFDAGELIQCLEDERVTGVFLVPTQWQAVCDYPDLSTRDLSSLRVLTWGAAPATDALLRRMTECFPTATNVAVFGQTEMSPITCVLHGKDSLRKIGSVGRPVPAVSARVVTPEMNDVMPGEVGEIVYRGPGVMKEYWNNPEATAEAFRNGWFHSGDLVRVDDEGYVYVVDRVKNMIISGGENIYCAEVENALAEHPSIAEVTVVGRSHPSWGETPVAYVVLRDGSAPLDVEQLRRWAADYLARYKLPTRLEVVTALPRNASGKVQKQLLA